MSDMAVEPVVPAEPAAEPAESAEPVEPAAEPWQEPLNELSSAVAYLAERLDPQQPEPGEQPLALDPFADDFGDRLGALLDQRLAPLMERHEHQQISESEERAMDIIADIESREGEFLVPEQSRKLARKLADDFMGQATQKFGVTPKAAEAALSEAYKQVRQIEDAIGKAYHDRQVNQARSLAGAPRDTPAGQVGSQERTVGPYRDGQSVSQRFFGRT